MERIRTSTLTHQCFANIVQIDGYRIFAYDISDVLIQKPLNIIFINSVLLLHTEIEDYFITEN